MDDLDRDLDRKPRRYWAQRHGHERGRIDLATAAELLRSTVEALQDDGFFQEWAGYSCVDGDTTGSGGQDPEVFAFRKTRLRGLWPPQASWSEWNEETLLTAIEFFRDVVSEPAAGRFHDYMGCGYHASAFDRSSGRARYRSEVNEFLGDLGQGYELGADGEVRRVIPDGFGDVVSAALPDAAGDEHQEMLKHAIAQFRARGSTPLAQRDAIKNLADVLESVRSKLKVVLNGKDERDLFEVLNRFGIRHRDPSQQTDYDADVFLPWVFYSHLAAVHAAFRLLDRANGGAVGQVPDKPMPDEEITWLR